MEGGREGEEAGNFRQQFDLIIYSLSGNDVTANHSRHGHTR